MGSCCNTTQIPTEPPISLSPDCRVKIINKIQELLSHSDCLSWPDGLSQELLLIALTYADITENDTRFPTDFKKTIQQLIKETKSLFLSGIKEKKQTIHTILVSTISINPFGFDINEEDYDSISQNIMDLIENQYFSINNIVSNDTIETFDKSTKQFIQFLLSWGFNDPRHENASIDNKYYIKLIEIATQYMNILQQPLIDEYQKLLQCDNQYDKQLIELEFKTNTNIKTQRDLYEEFSQWVQSLPYHNVNDNTDLYASLIVSEQHINEAIEQFKKHNLPNYYVVPYLYSDGYRNILHQEIYFEFFRQIAIEINDSFQNEMQLLFEQNRNEFEKLHGDIVKDKDAIFRSAPIKTCGRAMNKTVDYLNEVPPICGNVLDWVRCAFVVYNSNELMMLYDKILNKYKNGEIIRIKNGFKKDSETNYGYRAILINVLYEKNGFKMIVEIQIILLKYVKVRKRMHLFYKILRSEGPIDLAIDFSKTSDVDKSRTKNWVEC